MRLSQTDGTVTIIATTRAALDAEDRGGDALAVLLAVDPPLAWPPIFNDQGYAYEA